MDCATFSSLFNCFGKREKGDYERIISPENDVVTASPSSIKESLEEQGKKMAKIREVWRWRRVIRSIQERHVNNAGEVITPADIPAEPSSEEAWRNLEKGDFLTTIQRESNLNLKKIEINLNEDELCLQTEEATMKISIYIYSDLEELLEYETAMKMESERILREKEAYLNHLEEQLNRKKQLNEITERLSLPYLEDIQTRFDQEDIVHLTTKNQFTFLEMYTRHDEDLQRLSSSYDKFSRSRQNTLNVFNSIFQNLDGEITLMREGVSVDAMHLLKATFKDERDKIHKLRESAIACLESSTRAWDLGSNRANSPGSNVDASLMLKLAFNMQFLKTMLGEIDKSPMGRNAKISDLMESLISEYHLGSTDFDLASNFGFVAIELREEMKEFSRMKDLFFETVP